MRIKPLHILVIACLLAPCLRGQAEQGKVSSQKPSIEQIEQLRRQLQSLKSKYESVPILQTSKDYELFIQLKNDPKTAGLFISELIDLTVIKQQLPATTEKLRPIDISPAASLLLIVGESSQAEIQLRLAKSDLTEFQRQVLNEVSRYIDLSRAQSSPSGTKGTPPTSRPASLPPSTAPVDSTVKTTFLLWVTGAIVRKRRPQPHRFWLD